MTDDDSAGEQWSLSQNEAARKGRRVPASPKTFVSGQAEGVEAFLSCSSVTVPRGSRCFTATE